MMEHLILLTLIQRGFQASWLEGGIDPMAGVFHTDNPYRDSFVYDVMEASAGCGYVVIRVCAEPQI